MKHIDNETKSDSVKTAIEIFKNRGIEFPDESVEYVKEILSSDNYMSWEHCEVSDLHDYANNGVAVVGIDENRIVVIAPESDDEAEEKYPNILTYSDLTEEDFENMTFYAATASYYGGGTETPKPTPKIPTRIAQNISDPDWEESLWSPYKNLAVNGCGVACTSMALSCIGIDRLPSQIIAAQGGVVKMYWELHCNCYRYSDEEVQNEIFNLIDKYKSNPDKYAPPILRVTTRNNTGHYIVVCDYYIENGTKYFYAVDPAAPNRERGYWRFSDVRDHVVQYYR